VESAFRRAAIALPSAPVL